MRGVRAAFRRAVRRGLVRMKRMFFLAAYERVRKRVGHQEFFNVLTTATRTRACCVLGLPHDFDGEKSGLFGIE